MAADEQIDADLVERANRGEAEAFETLYRRHRDWVVSVAIRLGADREDALEILQDTFSYFFSCFPGFTLTSRLRTFLYPIVKHQWLDRCRRRETRQRLLRLVPPRDPAELTSDDRIDSRRLLDALNDDQREIVQMRFVDDLSLQDIADALGLPVGTVKSRLHAALARMRAARDRT